MSLDGGSLAFKSADEPKAVLIVASFPTERGAQDLMHELMDWMGYGGKRFDVRRWSDTVSQS